MTTKNNDQNGNEALADSSTLIPQEDGKDKNTKVKFPPHLNSFVGCLKSAEFWWAFFHRGILNTRNYFFLNPLVPWLKSLGVSNGDVSSLVNAFGVFQAMA